MNISIFRNSLVLAFIAILSFSLNAQGPILDISFGGFPTDNSPNGATIDGVARYGTDRFGEERNSLSFLRNHFDDLIVNAGAEELQTNGLMSFSVWVKRTSSRSNLYVFTTSDSARVHAGITLGITTAGNPLVQLGDGQGGSPPNRIFYTGNGAINFNDWGHIVVTLEPGQAPNIFLNGAPLTLMTPDGGNTSNVIGYNKAPFKIGQKWEHFFEGGIDDLKLYDRILSLQEIVDLSNNVSTTQSPSTSLVTVYPTVTSDNITIDLEERIDIEKMSIINAKGQQFSFSRIGGNTFDVSTLTPGHYFISGSTSGKSFVSQFNRL